MRYLSFIFSFDTLQLRPGWPRGLLLALALLAAIDFGVSRADWPYRRLGPSYVKEFLCAVDRANAGPPPRIVIVGDSRSQCGVIAGQLEAALQWPPGSVQNDSLLTGDHYDNRLFYQRTRGTLSRAPVLIYAIDGFQWNAGFPMSERFNHFAGVADRWRLQRSPRSLLGAIFRTAQKGSMYRALAADGLARTRARLMGTAAPAPPSAGLILAAEREPLSLDEAHGLDPVGNLVETWYKDFALSPAREALLRDILGWAAASDQRVILLQLPFRDAYVAELKRTRAREYEAYRQAAAALPGTELLAFESARDCGLTDADFLDWNHLNKRGGTTFTRQLAARLLAEGWVEGGDTTAP
ncbi:MAG: hypothetical protein K8T26_03210 [Lentisphaerae bacterium]|nr:hypothetical protein [Lentisphaerota bacterium]